MTDPKALPVRNLPNSSRRAPNDSKPEILNNSAGTFSLRRDNYLNDTDSSNPDETMSVMKKMPSVSACAIGECAYNINKSCHAVAITIGDGVHPLCDTYFSSMTNAASKETAGVGACKVSICRYNKTFKCGATDIQIGKLSNQAACLTFAAL